MRAISAAIFDSEGPVLTADEKRFFRDVNPYGFILFARHCETTESVNRLVGELKSLTGNDHLPILIDQEGGRVARLKPPHWPKYPPAQVFADMAKHDLEKAQKATYLNARLIAHDLYSLGITVDCAPLADLPVEGAHDVIGDRAFGKKAEQVIALARAMANGLIDGGIVPVLKHIPGHGRAFSDSHHELPVVNTPLEELRATDFVPFKALADLPMAMTAHVRFTAIDSEHIATQSKTVIDLIRGELGFDNLLMSDDLSMKAMHGSLKERTTTSLNAGCDVVLHCNSTFSEKVEVADVLTPMEGKALKRGENAMASVAPPTPYDPKEIRAELEELLAVYA